MFTEWVRKEIEVTLDLVWLLVTGRQLSLTLFIFSPLANKCQLSAETRDARPRCLRTVQLSLACRSTPARPLQRGLTSCSPAAHLQHLADCLSLHLSAPVISHPHSTKSESTLVSGFTLVKNMFVTFVLKRQKCWINLPEISFTVVSSCWDIWTLLLCPLSQQKKKPFDKIIIVVKYKHPRTVDSSSTSDYWLVVLQMKNKTKTNCNMNSTKAVIIQTFLCVAVDGPVIIVIMRPDHLAKGMCLWPSAWRACLVTGESGARSPSGPSAPYHIPIYMYCYITVKKKQDKVKNLCCFYATFDETTVNIIMLSSRSKGQIPLCRGLFAANGASLKVTAMTLLTALVMVASLFAHPTKPAWIRPGMKYCKFNCPLIFSWKWLNAATAVQMCSWNTSVVI